MMNLKNTAMALLVSTAYILGCAYVDRGNLEVTLLSGILFLLLYMGFEGETL